MKYLKSLILFITVAAVSGCSKERNCNLDLHYGNTFTDSGYTTIYCDSSQMQGLTKATVWVDGVGMSVYAETFITPSCNRYHD